MDRVAAADVIAFIEAVCFIPEGRRVARDFGCSTGNAANLRGYTTIRLARVVRS